MTIVCVLDSPGASLPSSRIDPPFRPAVSVLFDPLLVVNCPAETSRHSADSESNSHPGLRSHIALTRGARPSEMSAALPQASALGSSRLVKNTPLPGITLFTLAD